MKWAQFPIYMFTLVKICTNLSLYHNQTETRQREKQMFELNFTGTNIFNYEMRSMLQTENLMSFLSFQASIAAIMSIHVN